MWATIWNWAPPLHFQSLFWTFYLLSPCCLHYSRCCVSSPLMNLKLPSSPVLVHVTRPLVTQPLVTLLPPSHWHSAAPAPPEALVFCSPSSRTTLRALRVSAGNRWVCVASAGSDSSSKQRCSCFWAASWSDLKDCARKSEDAARGPQSCCFWSHRYLHYPAELWRTPGISQQRLRMNS